MIKYIVGLSLLAGLLISACSKSTIVGSEILTDDFVNVQFSDSSTLKVINHKADSIRIYPVSSQWYLLGNIEDPVFGTTEMEVYTQIRKMFEVPDLKDAVLDSVILSLSTNRNGLWGDTLADHSLMVYELAESIDDYDSIYTSQRFEAGALIGTKDFRPYSQDTSVLIVGEDTITNANSIRIPLDLSFGEKYFMDTLKMNDDTLITTISNGLVIRSESASNSVFGMNSGVYLDDHTNKIIFYYSKGDTLSQSHSITLGGKRGVYYGHDFSSAMVKDYFNNEEASDTLLFVAGTQNSEIEIEVPYLDGLDNALINFAEIEFYVAELDERLPYDNIQKFYLYNRADDGSISYIADLSISIINDLDNYYNAFIVDEVLDDGTIINKYNINITNELKRRIEEEDTGTKMLLSPYQSQARANRSILYGPNHSQYPAKLKITYTTE